MARKDAVGTRAWSAMLLLFLVGCSAEVGDSQSAGEEGEAARVEQAFSGWWYYSWGVTNLSDLDIGSNVNRTCFLSGIAGNMRPQYGPQAVSTRLTSATEYALEVETFNKPLAGHAQCVNTAAGRTNEVMWTSNGATEILGAVTAHRRCFLTEVATVGLGGMNASTDYVKVWQDGSNWYLGGVQSGMTVARARCIDVNEQVSHWVWQAGSSQTRKDKIADNVNGVACFLTGVGGKFDTNGWNDGAYITYEPATHEFFLNTRNGKKGWVTCVR